MVTGELALRLVALLRIAERGSPLFGVMGDDVVLDAWFGRRAPSLTGLADDPSNGDVS